VRQRSDSTKNDLKATLSELSTTSTSFSNDLKDVLQRSEAEMKNLAEVLEAAERIGKYEAVLPLLKLNENAGVGETEALVSMWNISNIFIQWFAKQKMTSTRSEILDLLKRTLVSISQEIQTIGG
jgi:hypothetical protein